MKLLVILITAILPACIAIPGDEGPQGEPGLSGPQGARGVPGESVSCVSTLSSTQVQTKCSDGNTYYLNLDAGVPEAMDAGAPEVPDAQVYVGKTIERRSDCDTLVTDVQDMTMPQTALRFAPFAHLTQGEILDASLCYLDENGEKTRCLPADTYMTIGPALSIRCRFDTFDPSLPLSEQNWPSMAAFVIVPETNVCPGGCQ